MKRWDRFGGVQNVLTLGIQMAVGMAVFTWLGWRLDRARGEGRTFTLCGMFLGLFYGFYEVWKVIRQGNRGEEEDRPLNTRKREREEEQPKDRG